MRTSCQTNATITNNSSYQIAKDMGLRTITVLAERPEDDLTAQCVMSLGGNMVVHDTYLHTKVRTGYTFILNGEDPINPFS